jgi:hypothetical protein
MPEPSPRTRTRDAQPPADPVQSLREIVVTIGNKMLEEVAARQRLQFELRQLQAEVMRQRAAIRTAGRR